MDKITPRADLHFTGKSGKRYHLQSNKPVGEGGEDWMHVGCAYSAMGVQSVEPEQPKNKKK